MALPPAVSPRRPRGLNARLVMVGVALTLAWLGVGYRLVVVQGTRAEEYAAQGLGQRLHTETLAADRGTIFDAEGRELALTVDLGDGVRQPARGHRPGGGGPLSGLPDRAGPGCTSRRLLSGDGTFVYVARQLDPADAERGARRRPPGHLLPGGAQAGLPGRIADRSDHRVRPARQQRGPRGPRVPLRGGTGRHPGAAAGGAGPGGPHHPPGGVLGDPGRAGERPGADAAHLHPVRRHRGAARRRWSGPGPGPGRWWSSTRPPAGCWPW